MSKQTQWLVENELPRLTASGVIDQETCRRISDFYKQETEDATSQRLNLAVVMLSVLGGLLISCGLILLIAYNWDMFPRMVRITLALLPLLLAAILGTWVIRSSRGPALCEPAALLTGTGAATALAIISQIYSLDGSFHDFILTLLTVTLPATLIFRSTALGAIQCAFLLSQAGSNDTGWGTSILTLVICLCLLWFVSRQLKTASPWHGWLLRLMAGWLIIFMPYLNVAEGASSPLRELSSFAAGATLIFLLGLRLHLRNQQLGGREKNPWLFCGFILWIISFFILKTETRIGLGDGDFLFTGFAAAYFIAAVVLCIPLKQRHLWVTAATTPVFTVLLLCNITDDGTISAAMLVPTVFWCASGIFMLHGGLKQKDTVLALLGLTTLFVIAVYYFAVSDFGMLPRALGLIICGLTVSVSTIRITRHCRKSNRIQEVEK